MIIVKNSAELAAIRKSCELSAMALAKAGEAVAPGITTLDIDKIIRSYLKEKGAKPSFLGYNGFRGNACISVNDELIHGIPSKKRFLREGDIVTIDVGAFYGGFHGDNSATFPVGKISQHAQRLLAATKECLAAGIAQCTAGKRVGDIGCAIEETCKKNGYFIVRDFVGHGVGRTLHEDPEIPNYGKAGRGQRLAPGMTLAIEPMLNETTSKTITLPDGWTVVEANRKLCAHYEHTIAVTDGEPVILTLLK